MKNFVVFVITAVVVGAIGSLFLFMQNRQVAFDREAWMTGSPDRPLHNPRMVKDICETFRGKPKDSVIALLGKSENYSNTSKDEIYYLIHQENRGIDPVRLLHLVLKLDEKTQQVRECGVLSHVKGEADRYEALPSR